jgi:hypothetical protein
MMTPNVRHDLGAWKDFFLEFLLELATFLELLVVPGRTGNKAHIFET